MPAPLVSVLVPLHDAGPMLEKCLASVFRQSHPALELVVVDNVSTDGSAARAEALFASAPRGVTTTLLRNPEPHQQNVTRRMAFEASRGDFVQWLDADDTLADDKIARQVAALAATPDADYAMGELVHRHYAPQGDAPADAPLVVVRDTVILPARVHDDFRDAYLFSPTTPNRYLFRRSAAERLHEACAWDPTTPRRADWHHQLANAALGHVSLLVPNSPAFYSKWGATQMHARTNAAARARATAHVLGRLRALIEERRLDVPPAWRRYLDAPVGAFRVGEAAVRRNTGVGGGLAREVLFATLLREKDPFVLADIATRVAQIEAPFCGAHDGVFQTLLDFVQEGHLVPEDDDTHGGSP